MIYEIRRIDINLSNYYEEYVYCQYKEGSEPMIGKKPETIDRLNNEEVDEDEKIIELVKENTEMQLRKEICDKIMSGEIPLKYDVGDWDCVDMSEADFKKLNKHLYII